MKTLLISTVIATTIATASMAETNIKKEPLCDNTDIAIGAGIGIVGGAIIGVTSLIGLPVVGPGVAAGTTLTARMAFSHPFLFKGTLHSALAGMAIPGPIIGGFSYYVSCVSKPMSRALFG